MTGAGERPRRPGGVAAVAILLLALGGLTALAGIAASAASSCCGSPDPADPTPALVGLFAAAGVAAAGIGLWRGRMSRRALLLASVAFPAVLLAASPRSTDLLALAPLALLAWLALWWYLRRPVPADWLRRRDGGRGR